MKSAGLCGLLAFTPTAVLVISSRELIEST